MRNPNQETWESFSEFLSSKGLRMTDQRKGVIEALFRQSGHFTAEQLLRDAQDLDETVSRATLYRSLPLLVESGIIRKVERWSGQQVLCLERPIGNLQSSSHLFGLQPHRGY